MKPFLVKEIRKKVGGTYQVAQTYSPQQFSQAVSPEVAKTITQMMIGVMQDGTGKWLKRIYKTEEGKYITARKAEGTEIQVAGKTGTAETDKSKPSHSWFVAFAPADNPQVAICVLAEHAGFGATVAGPIAMEILATALNLKP